jgi:hypothetical protein
VGGFEKHAKPSRRAEFLAQMDPVVPSRCFWIEFRAAIIVTSPRLSVCIMTP